MTEKIYIRPRIIEDSAAKLALLLQDEDIEPLDEDNLNTKDIFTAATEDDYFAVPTDDD